MYAKFFGLLQEPFSIAPDPRYLFMSERHREALAHLLYGVKGGGGFVLLTGEIGAGKTTVCRCFLEQIPKRCNVAYVFNPKLTVTELLRTVCDEFRVPMQGLPAVGATVKDYTDRLNEFLLRTHAVGMINVLIIDEAQALSADVLEQLRLLTNLETSERKLLQIILIGQPELRKMLTRPDLEQVSQRVIARYHLKALTEEETDRYIRHRLGVAGMTRPVPFERDAIRRIHQITGGIPRRINLLCDRAMLGAYSAGQERIGRDVVGQAAREVFEKPTHAPGPAPSPEPSRTASHRNRWIALGAGGGVLAGALIAGGVAWSVLRGAGPADGTPLAASAAVPAEGGGPAASAGEASEASATAAGTPASSTAAAPPAPVAPSGTAASPSAAAAVPTPGTPATGAPAAAASAPPAPPAAASPRGAAAATPPDGPTTSTALPPGTRPLNGMPSSLLDEPEAWRQLAGVWQAAPLEGEPCTALQRQRLFCYRGGGQRDLNLLRRLDRPAVLVVQDSNGVSGHVVLLSLDIGGATLRVGDTRYLVPLDVLQSRWRGDFATLWRPPPGYAPDAIEVGTDTEAARWVESRLDTLTGRQAVPLGALRDRVQRFQRNQGLVADGLAGPITLMQLNRASGVDEPRLRDAR